jgi:hypothetical protein
MSEKSNQLAALRVLARAINEAHQAVVTAANSALEKAQMCGKALLEAKESVPHGGWLDWLAKNCDGISEATATRYMRLAKVCTVQDLENAKTITQVYLAAGIIKEKAIPVEAPKPSSEPVTTAASAYCAAAGIAAPTPVIDVPAAVETPKWSTLIPIQEAPAVEPPRAPAPEASPLNRFAHLDKLVIAVMEEITSLGDQQADQPGILATLAPIRQYLECRGQL